MLAPRSLSEWETPVNEFSNSLALSSIPVIVIRDDPAVADVRWVRDVGFSARSGPVRKSRIVSYVPKATLAAAPKSEGPEFQNSYMGKQTRTYLKIARHY
jgi:hypothetical protein